MNKTPIEWTDLTWNPVTGCWGPGGTAEKPNRCPYCYALKLNQRFGRPFAPMFHPNRLFEPAKVKKPSKIFVCSMADLFGDWVPDGWICRIISEVLHAPQHTFQFLTKNPKRLCHFIWPKNAWVGTTVTNQADADERLPWLLQVDAPVRFVSHEPLMGAINVGWAIGLESVAGNLYKYIDWVIIGAMTGPGAVKVEPAWVIRLEAQYQKAGVPVFEKDNLQSLCGPGATLLRAWPTLEA